MALLSVTGTFHQAPVDPTQLSSDLASLLTAETINTIAESDISFVRNEVAGDIWPSWKNGTLQLQPMLDFIHRLLVDPSNTYTETREGSLLQRRMFIETPYIVSQSGLYCSSSVKKRNMRFQQRNRLMPVEGLMNEALKLFHSSQKSERQAKWAQLDNLLAQGHSVPFLVYPGDYRSCGFHNFRDENNVSQSLPLFTFGVKANALGCWNGFPIASYKMIRDSKRTWQDWDQEFEETDKRYPWHKKIYKVAWRGSLTDRSALGDLGLFDGVTPRMKLVALGNHAYNKTQLFDVGFASTQNFEKRNISSVDYPTKGPINPFSEMQRYIAIIDIDGNGWSSRFPTQLCLNSVSLKVEPRYPDYFVGSQVKPGVHYIPIKPDLSDLLEKTLWVMLHPRESQQIVANAREWCREHMVWKSLAHDMLDIWEKYVTWLNEHDPSWSDIWEKQWKIWKRRDFPSEMLQPFKRKNNGPLRFRPVKVTPELQGFLLGIVMKYS
ncbi:hypothetical protein FisN_18Lh128 [Fistulifera solaris]|uniref:Glycosyl transferase CAP10 domain-containing protein n=1 Tax=Fistulifera solaris TaxID=1519565 RepID=A0A1Z5KES4_FISSO|nr:hypothetical protein FisN_18Lh128 [Fistulifera solaris]|eukprot:GAX24793.1 hypothetical protein FisN_18Lh128 [Fistulifera solaris]